MSGVIKRRGDEGQRGKERWRTEGDRESEMGTKRNGNTSELGFYYTTLEIAQEHFYGLKNV